LVDDVGDVADVVALAAGHDGVAVGPDDSGAAASGDAGRGAGRDLAGGLGGQREGGSRWHVERPGLAVERAHPAAENAEVLAVDARLRLAGDEDEAHLAVAGLGLGGLAGG